MLSRDIVDLHNDDFEGSNDELRIAQEVFYGNVASFCSKTCTTAGVTNSESEHDKMVEISLCSNSENSAITNQISSKGLCQKDSGGPSSMEGTIVGGRLEHDFHAKRMKLSVNELSNFKPYLDKAVASSIPLKQVISGMYDPASHSDCPILMCHVVESSNEGLTSSCYLLKQYHESDIEGNLGDGSTEVKQVGGSKSIASPISQESSATKLLVSSPLSTMVSESESLRCANRRSVRAISPELEDDDVPLTSENTNDPRALLRSRVFHLLKKGRWSIEKRKRGNGRYRNVYRSPEGKLIREFHKIWYLFGQSLSAQVDDKQWTDFGQFWTDLHDTLNYIDNKMNGWEPTYSLARQWTLMDPFVTLVLIDRKIHTLRASNLVKAKQSNIIGVDSKAEVEFSLTSMEHDRKRAVDTQSENIVCGSYLASDSAVIDGGGLSKEGEAENCKSKSVYVSEGNSFRLVKTISDQHVGSCTDEQVNMYSSQSACMSDTCGQSETFSPHQGSCMSSPSCNKQNMELSKEHSKYALRSLVGGVEPLERVINDVGVTIKKKIDNKSKKRRSMDCHLKDNDLLISAIIKKRSFKSSTNQCNLKSGKFKLKALKQCKSSKGQCRLLLRSLGKGGKHLTERWSLMGQRTVLSWLISAGALFINEAIQYRAPKDDRVVKDGLITRDGVLCKCCSEVFSISEFKIHAGFKQNRPCLNLFMGSGRPYTLCQLQAWSDEYKARKSSSPRITVDEFDRNDDSCGLCGDGGELLCCDNCPSTFHQSCLSAEALPEGSWYCLNCTCQLCGDLVNEKEISSSNVAVKCSQCEQKYHLACLIDKGIGGIAGAPWFCGVGCEEVYTGLQSRIGSSNLISDGYSWTLLRCIHDDQKVPSPQRFALKAECNSKLAVAVTIMEECFLSMTDPRTGIDMIPQVIYNWGSEFARLDYHGFYTAVLEKDDVLISVASIRYSNVLMQPVGNLTLLCCNITTCEGDTFTCPVHVCFVCQHLEHKTILAAECRCCPKAYH